VSPHLYVEHLLADVSIILPAGSHRAALLVRHLAVNTAHQATLQ
jgi:hypothetical protein